MHLDHEHLHSAEPVVHFSASEVDELTRRKFIMKSVGVAVATMFSGQFLAACGKPEMVDEYGDPIPGAAGQAPGQLSRIDGPAKVTAQAKRLDPPDPPVPTSKYPPILIPPGSRVVDGDPAFAYISGQIDDIPSPNISRGMMDVCDYFGVPGALGMMCVGIVMKQHPDVVQEMNSRGHRVHSHSMTHSYNINQNINEIDAMQQLIKDMTGQDNKLFTNPGGYVNKTLLDFLASRGLYYRWVTIDMRDWTSPRDSAAILRSRISGALANGRHFLFHGSETHGNTLEALPFLFSEAKARGLTVISPEEHMAIGNPTIRAAAMLQVQTELQDEYVKEGKFAGISQLEANWLLTLESLLENSVSLSKDGNQILKDELALRKQALGIG